MFTVLVFANYGASFITLDFSVSVPFTNPLHRNLIPKTLSNTRMIVASRRNARNAVAQVEGMLDAGFSARPVSIAGSNTRLTRVTSINLKDPSTFKSPLGCNTSAVFEGSPDSDSIILFITPKILKSPPRSNPLSSKAFAFFIWHSASSYMLVCHSKEQATTA